ncbi:hypothetical protein [Halobacteriovorax marinus]|uniref:hypothetical protein n=1 Tax=Halobacteriovorax marinus TaxID=97084 RepID=UPI003A8EBAD5
MKTKKVILTIFGLGIFLMSNSLVLANECSDGLIWNETIKDCLNAEDDNRVNEKQRMCDSKAEGAAKDECNRMVQSFDKGPAEYASVKGVGEASSKEKSLGTINTAKSVIGGAVAAYKLFEAYKAAKSVKSALSGMCISGMMSVATGIMSFMNDRNTKKNSENAIKESQNKLNKLIAQNKRTKGTSFEMQIQLMAAYKEMLDSGAVAAGIREDGYKQEVTMYSISLGIAGIELLASLYGEKTRVKCASWVLGSSAISLVLGNQMKSAAADAKKKYESESEKLGKILKKYQDFFMRKHIDQSALAMRSSINNGAGAPINARSNNEANDFGNKNLTEEQKNMCQAAPDTECCNDSGKSCPTFSVAFSDPTVASATQRGDLGGIIGRANSSLQTGLGTPNGMSEALDKDLQRARAFKQRVLKHLKDKGNLTAAQAELLDEKKQMKAFLKKQFGNENARLASSFGDNMALPDTDRISKILEKSEVPKELAKEKSKLSSSLSGLASLANKNYGLDDLDLEDENESGNASDMMASSSSLDEGEEYIYDREEIVEKPEVSIFQVISNRYNVLRINKRFGQRASK